MTEKDMLRLIGTTQSQDIVKAMETRKNQEGLSMVNKNQGQKLGKYEKKNPVGRKILIAAIAAALALAGCAAVVHYRHGLIEDLKLNSLQDPAGYEQLLVTAPQTQEAEKTSAEPELVPLASARDQMAEYQVLEAILDSESLYLHERIVPLQEDVIFIDQQVMPEDPVEMLENPELSGGTVQEFADSQGKKLFYARLVESFDSDIINGWGMHAKTDTDGSLHLYGSGNNPSQIKTLALRFEGFTYTLEAGPSRERTSFDLTLKDESSSDEIVYRTFRAWDRKSPDIEKDLGFVIDSLTMKKTELGIYATFTYHPTQELQKKIQDEITQAQKIEYKQGDLNEEGLPMELVCSPDYIRGQHMISFSMLDEQGEYFKTTGPSGGNQGIVDNGDGTYSYTYSIPNMESTGNLKFRVMDGNMEKVGTYAYSR